MGGLLDTKKSYASGILQMVNVTCSKIDARHSIYLERQHQQMVKKGGDRDKIIEWICNLHLSAR
jgi:hypothetical protein